MYYHRRDVPLDQLRDVIRGHRRVVGEDSSALLKNSLVLLFRWWGRGKGRSV